MYIALHTIAITSAQQLKLPVFDGAHVSSFYITALHILYGTTYAIES